MAPTTRSVRSGARRVRARVAAGVARSLTAIAAMRNPRKDQVPVGTRVNPEQYRYVIVELANDCSYCSAFNNGRSGAASNAV